MSKILYRWGRSAAQHPWRMLFAWLVVVIAVVGLKSSIGGSTSDNFKIPGTESQQGIDLLNDRFPSQGGSSGQVVFADPDGDVTDAVARATIGQTLGQIADDPNVVIGQRSVRPEFRIGQRRRADRLRDRAVQRRPAGEIRRRSGKGCCRDGT